MKPKCDSCGKRPTKTIGLRGFKLTRPIGGLEYSIVVRLCDRGCAERMLQYRRANKTTDPPEIVTMWGGEQLRPLPARSRIEVVK